MADTNLKPWGETTVVGKPLPRIDAKERLSGTAVYPLDTILPDMLYGAILRCPHAHALVKKVDASKARSMPGVRAALTDADPDAQVPWFGSAADRTKMVSRLFDPRCRYEGEEVAAVAAESPQQAWDAVKAIQVEYQKLPFATDMEAALKPDAPAIHEGGNHVGDPIAYNRGDVAKGFAEADVVLEETYRTSCEIHTPMEVHGSVAHWEGDRLTLWDTNQGPFPIQGALATALKMPLSKVRVISPYMGGGFGSKQELGKYSAIAAILARKTARPVKLFLTREETFLCTGNRPAHIMKLKAGVKKDGTLTALQLTGTGEVGAYPGGSSRTAAGYQVQDLYKCPNVKTDELQVYINAGQNRAFRAPGFPQCSWALEQMMDALAEKIGMDPIDLRLKNFSPLCQVEDNKPYTSTGLREALTQGAAAFGWKEARALAKGNGPWVRGVGVAGGMWGQPGRPPSTAIVKYYLDGSANLNIGAADLGTGTKTVMAMVVAEELGVPIERIEVVNADTGTTQYTGASGGSKTVMTDSPAVRAAAVEVKSKLLAMAAEQLKLSAASLTLKNGEISGPGGAPKVAVGALPDLRAQQVVVGVGIRGPNITEKSIRPFAAHFAEVEVNIRTGEVRVLRMIAAQDSGRVMNLSTYRSQVIGGLTFGIGFAMTERRVLDPQTGKMVNGNWHDYKIATAKDAPAELTCLPIDLHDNECDTTSAKGLGEPATVPAAAAIANAFYNATGIRVKDAPITVAKVVGLLAERRKQG
ncbi:MAG: xanthine dehydrogenase family protein molybdopterin-binding subunit [Bryobacteraceae bacterium]|jgi:xanthine dehydrogenase YagR molybdenum-binding subunit